MVVVEEAEGRHGYDGVVEVAVAASPTRVTVVAGWTAEGEDCGRSCGGVRAWLCW